MTMYSLQLLQPTVDDVVDDVEDLIILSDQFQRALECDWSLGVNVESGTQGADGS